MNNTIKLAFEILNKNLLLTQPLIVFIFILSISSGMINRLQNNLPLLLVYTLAMGLLFIAFVAGWGNMFKNAISSEINETLSDEEKRENAYNIGKYFFSGVGEYFLSVLGLSILYFFITAIISFLIFKLGVQFIGIPNIDFAKLNEASATFASSQNYFASLPVAEYVKLTKWLLLIMSVSTGLQYITMWWFTSLFNDTKNPFLAISFGTKFFFKNILNIIVLALFLFLLHVITSMINVVFVANVILSLVAFIVFIYYITYYIVLIFLYYAKETKNNINSRNDCIG